MKRGGDEERNGADEQTGKMNADEDWRWWDKRETGGRGEKKHSDGRLKYLWCHLCWRMTPPLCNNMNEDSTGCLESQISPALYIAIHAFVFRGVSALIEAPSECGGRWKRHSLLRKKQRHNVTNEFQYLASRWRTSVQPNSGYRLWLTSCCYVPHFII